MSKFIELTIGGVIKTNFNVNEICSFFGKDNGTKLITTDCYKGEYYFVSETPAEIMAKIGEVQG